MQRSHASGGFGRKIDPQAQEMERRREAFLAAERSRKADERQPTPPSMGAPRPSFVRNQKSLALAYIFWFGCGTISAHRFYLGFTRSAVVQASLWIVGWLMVAGGMFVALLAVFAAALWLLGDAFLMPGLCRQANERSRQLDVASTFA